ncbi:hypothetical protein Hdeb2414_s0029g00705141 [Helianthus debilis subsp. tardiflorus]
MPFVVLLLSSMQGGPNPQFSFRNWNGMRMNSSVFSRFMLSLFGFLSFWILDSR